MKKKSSDKKFIRKSIWLMIHQRWTNMQKSMPVAGGGRDDFLCRWKQQCLVFRFSVFLYSYQMSPNLLMHQIDCIVIRCSIALKQFTSRTETYKERTHDNDLHFSIFGARWPKIISPTTLKATKLRLIVVTLKKPQAEYVRKRKWGI